MQTQQYIEILQIESIEQLEELAKHIADELQPPTVVCLKGDLGVGKTTFAGFIINHLSSPIEQEVTSPTFNIAHTYDTNKGTIWHFDLYRIQSYEELEELGVEDAVTQLAIIEWPEIALPMFLGMHMIDIRMTFSGCGAPHREVVISRIQALEKVEVL